MPGPRQIFRQWQTRGNPATQSHGSPKDSRVIEENDFYYCIAPTPQEKHPAPVTYRERMLFCWTFKGTGIHVAG
jgi:hypothetical protein